MPSVDADIAVVGLGAMGACALWRLADRGTDVIGFERFDPGHPWGSTHGSTRLFRTACREHPVLVPLAQTSLGLWRKLEEESARPLLDITGGLMIGAPDTPVVAGTLAAATTYDLPVRTLSAAEVTDRFPQHARLPDHHMAVWDPLAGVVRPEAGVLAAVIAAQKAGATVYPRTDVSGIDLVAGGVLIRTAARDFRVRQAVVTTGPWLGKLVPELPLEAVRTPMTWFDARDDPASFELKRFPVFIRTLPDGTGIWGHGAVDGHPSKVGLSDDPSLPVIDPDQCDRAISPADYRLLSEIVTAALPGLHPHPVRTTTCMITRSPDGQFQVGRPHHDPRLVVGGGGSGHAFKHATGIGELLARIACDEAPFVELDVVDPNRFLR
ncbi:N-methyl-L-tryptophan oxidase [Actinopolymorpha sp. B11F2]|uniref:N-methyl-L-tryptophan oxidase n=1 Tax=Actinopolymorpha sp. B11F2 TaxID=3160862 RepID=UPI0032E5277B